MPSESSAVTGSNLGDQSLNIAGELGPAAEPGHAPGLVHLEVRHASNPTELAQIFDFRQRAWRGHSDYLLGNRAGMHPAEDRHDALAFHFTAALGGELVAACRWCLPGERGFEAQELTALPSGCLEPRGAWLQISRLVVREDLRRQAVSELLLLHACLRLRALQAPARWFALAVPKLSEYYVRFGGSPLEGFEVTLEQRFGQRYRLVRGDLGSSIVAIAGLLKARGPEIPWRLEGLLTAVDGSGSTAPSPGKNHLVAPL